MSESNKVCSVDGCEREQLCRDLCRKHYMRARRAELLEDPAPAPKLPEIEGERWLPVVGFEGLYEVSDHGRVYSVRRRTTRGGILKAGSNVNKLMVYLETGSGKVARMVHRLVMEAFVGPRPEGLVTRHMDGDYTNNRLENLRYGTYSDNNFDAVRHGTHSQASKTYCPSGHEYTEENTYRNPVHPNKRVCRACRAEHNRRYRAARKGKAA